MAEDKVRLGGMALANGVLVHGPTSWACAIRTDDGEVKVVARRKRVLASKIESPLLRGPVRLLDAMAIIPQIRHALPEAKLPFQRPSVLAAMLGSATVVKLLRSSPSVRPVAQELVGGLLSLAPAVLALRGSEVAAYHGAEHISIGTYENGGERAPKEHPRCGSQLIAPMVATSLAANVVAAKAPAGTRRLARLVGTAGAIGGSVEIFSWVARNPSHPVARALARPGFELQRHFSTAEPSDDQLEVADAARDACLELERQRA
jgi:uncharacterized protein YqhQ